MIAAALCFAALAASAEPPVLPDPIGLGERLVLIEHLRADYGLRPAPGATLEELRAAYAAAWGARQRPIDAIGEDSGLAEREARLRRRIADRHGVEADRALDESGLIALLHRLDDERARRDSAAIAERVAADRDRPAPAEPEAALPSAPAAAAGPAPEAPAPVARAAADPAVVRIRFPARGVADCWLATQGERRCLLVAFGVDHNGAFGTIRQEAWRLLAQAPAIRRSVLLLGHGGGTDVGGENIEAHLRGNKRFYETMGGTMPEAAVECLVLASCSAGNPDQMRAMRDGLGYFPTWRVATGPRAYATQVSVLAALAGVAPRAAAPAWRGLYRMGESGDAVGAFGEVGRDGERAETTYWRLVPDQASRTWKTVEQR